MHLAVAYAWMRATFGIAQAYPTASAFGALIGVLALFFLCYPYYITKTNEYG